jgi:hypothetical protein
VGTLDDQMDGCLQQGKGNKEAQIHVMKFGTCKQDWLVAKGLD